MPQTRLSGRSPQVSLEDEIARSGEHACVTPAARGEKIVSVVSASLQGVWFRNATWWITHTLEPTSERPSSCRACRRELLPEQLSGAHPVMNLSVVTVGVLGPEKWLPDGVSRRHAMDGVSFLIFLGTSATDTLWIVIDCCSAARRPSCSICSCWRQFSFSMFVQPSVCLG